MMCKNPFYLESAGGVVGCGRCAPCRYNKRDMKATRIILESKLHEHCLFVTLSYSNRYLPTDVYNPVTGELIASHPLGCLDRRAIQLFLKRLRKKLPPKSLRAFYCGEYGEKRGRPHYHLILWGLPYEKRHLIYESWQDPHTGDLMCDPDRLDVQLPRNDAHVGAYVAKYVVKKLTTSDKRRLDGRPPEFSGGSKGLALAFVDKIVEGLQSGSGQSFIEEFHDVPRRLNIDGKLRPIDRYLKEKIIAKTEIQEKIKANTHAKYGQEMQALLLRAAQNPRIPKTWIDDPVRKAWALEKQAEEERAASSASFERKIQLKNSNNGDF